LLSDAVYWDHLRGHNHGRRDIEIAYKWVESDPTDEHAHMALASELCSMGYSDEALDVADRALATLTSTTPRVHLQLLDVRAAALFSLRRFHEARTCAQDGLNLLAHYKLEPLWAAKFWAMMAACAFHRSQNYREARDYALKVLAVEEPAPIAVLERDTFLMASRLLVRSLVALKEYHAAYRAAKAALEWAPREPELRQNFEILHRFHISLLGGRPSHLDALAAPGAAILSPTRR
jgi:tetratricopeptide (TPR) repeat protein